MPISRVVINASPLIVLFRSQQAELLPQLFEEIVIPQGVWEEVLARQPEDIAAQQLRTVPWLRRIDRVENSTKIAAWDLGKGESEVLSWVASHPGYAAIVDDSTCLDWLDLDESANPLATDFLRPLSHARRESQSEQRLVRL
ncbi:hypothetical protein XM38_040520 [Halomicronema hongdechloris C2206]|uniref:PIN domain-containing protein n=1 Tax=Halomicronema hongdechloris C2206 TaxID=1641165 RepID=A0A1Z3HS02_9CYAN|nr:hypothetical protein XM38_040520 [Halomicronema hongdechloris C2206]